jgi:general secretion pathway protein C
LKSTSWCVDPKETMNKRLPILLSLLALILLAASIAYWVLQLYQPQQRPLAAAPVVSQPAPSPDAAATLFGGQPMAAAISNFQLTGVVAAGSANSAAIIVADGAPPVAVRIGREIAPGVVVSEVHQRYIMLLDAGVPKRIDLAADTRAPATMNAPAPMTASAPAPMAVPPGMEQQTAPGVVSAPPAMQSVPPAGGGPQGTPTTPDNAEFLPEPQGDQGYDPNSSNTQQQFQQQQQQQQQQQNNQVQMPPNAAPMNQPSQQNPVR